MLHIAVQEGRINSNTSRCPGVEWKQTLGACRTVPAGGIATDDELQALQGLGVHTAGLVPVNLAPKLADDERVVGLTEDEVEDLQDLLHRGMDEVDDKP